MLAHDQFRHRKRYPSDLTDEQWALVAPLIPPAKQSQHGGRPREVDMRAVLNTLLYLNRSGCQWAMLPHDLLPKSTVDDYFAQWRDDGTWTRLVNALRERNRVAAGREPTPSAYMDGSYRAAVDLKAVVRRVSMKIWSDAPSKQQHAADGAAGSGAEAGWSRKD
jgi:transposase